MSTQVILVPAGTQSVPFPITPLQSLCAGPAVLGGTVLVETGPSQTGPFTAWLAGSSANAASARPLTNQWARITATTQAAVAALSDMGAGVGTGNQMDALVSSNAAIASPSTASEVVLFSFRTPPNFLKPNFRMEIEGCATFTNSVNAKTLQARMNGLAGSLIFQSTALASNATLAFRTSVVGAGDGNTMKGMGSGLTSIGYGISTTAFVSLTRDYINNETEFVVTCTKATAAETFQLDSLLVNLYQ